MQSAARLLLSLLTSATAWLARRYDPSLLVARETLSLPTVPITVVPRRTVLYTFLPIPQTLVDISRTSGDT